MRRSAAAVSRHPDASHAVGEVIGEVLERVGVAAELAVVMVGGSHRDHLVDIADAIETTLRPGVLIGAGSDMVAANRREIERGPAIALFAARVDGVVPIRLTARRVDGGVRLGGLDPLELKAAHSMVLLADPFSMPTESMLGHLNDRHRSLTVVGGLASGGRRAGEARLVFGSEIVDSGAVGFLLGGRTRVDPIVSQGCRPIGDPFTVTESTGNLIHELAGRPATERLAETLRTLEAEDRALAASGLHVGRVVDERNVDHGPGDFVIRAVVGLDRPTGALAVGEAVPVGATLQFQVRDAATADAELRTLLAAAPPTEAALLFTCTGRGTHMFAESDHDAGLVSDLLDDRPLVGMACAGEIGPIGGQTFLHGFTASLGLLTDHVDRQPAVEGYDSRP